MVGIVYDGVLGTVQAVLLTLGMLDTVFLLRLFLALLGNIISCYSCGRNKIIAILAASLFGMNGNSALCRAHNEVVFIYIW